MWGKSIFGFFAGCVLSVSIMLNLNYLLPFAIDTKLLIGLLLGYPLWAGIMTYIYAQPTLKKALLHWGVAFSISIIINVLFF